MLLNVSSLLLLLAITALAAPAPSAFNGSAVIPDITVQQLQAAAPKICATVTEECHPAADAIKGINTAFKNYGLEKLGQKAALLGLMTLESGDFTYNVNHFPGRPGQGTKAMLMFPHIYKYAWSQPDLTAEVMRISNGITPDVGFGNMDKIRVEDQKAIRALVLPEKYTYAAAMWYLQNMCDAAMPRKLADNGFAGFKEYIGACVYAGDVTPDRLAKWCATVKALKPEGMAAPTECN
ncbi:hypothetical protein L873DRAFT_1844049 [Choiromyces venosus 120613-1]|uniref:Uncharacterized protein n=1 Tax=Choiromyces venosus 120613-1 TaxID=1336337 RepID=A0A3N4JKE1_9PEZI|nr:hypothetical protein L873DRAFT_1844049 [Choiromyces venosus 120613-1]